MTARAGSNSHASIIFAWNAKPTQTPANGMAYR